MKKGPLRPIKKNWVNRIPNVLYVVVPRCAVSLLGLSARAAFVLKVFTYRD